jgi:hypothetical protein
LAEGISRLNIIWFAGKCNLGFDPWVA